MVSSLSFSIRLILCSRQDLCTSSLCMLAFRGSRLAFRSSACSLLLLKASSPTCLLLSRAMIRGSYQPSSAFTLPLSRRCSLTDACLHRLTSLMALGLQGLDAWALRELSLLWWASLSWDKSWVRLWMWALSSSCRHQKFKISWPRATINNCCNNIYCIQRYWSKLERTITAMWKTPTHLRDNIYSYTMSWFIWPLVDVCGNIPLILCWQWFNLIFNADFKKCLSYNLYIIRCR